MSFGEARGIVYVPTGSAAFDFWGGKMGTQLGDTYIAFALTDY